MTADELTQTERNRIVLGALVAWLAQVPGAPLSHHESRELLKVLEGINPPSAIGLAHKIKETQP